MKLNKILITLIIFFSFPLFGNTLVVSITGPIDHSLIKEVEENVKDEKGTLLLHVNSRAGTLTDAVTLAKILYQWKVKTGSKICVFLGDNVIGPTAIFPFLADELASDWAASWGDLFYGQKGEYPPNILLSQINNFINDENSLYPTLLKGMVQPGYSLELNPQGKWTLIKDNESDTTLVLNQKQLKKIGLLSFIGSWDNYKARFDIDPSIIRKINTPEENLELSFEQSLHERIHFTENGDNLIGHITIGPQDKGIDKSTWIYVKSALDYYKIVKPSFIILELNTPGGEVHSAEKISAALREMDSQYGIPIVAYINNWAISAGALLTYSCRYVLVAPDASMGAAEPVFSSNGEMKSAPEKIKSVIRTDFAIAATYFGRNPSIAEAMVDNEISVVYRHGKIIKLMDNEEIRLKGPDKDIVITSKGKLLTLNSKQMLLWGVANAEVPDTKTFIPSEEKASAEESPIFSLPFFKDIPNTYIIPYSMSWREGFFSFLASPIIQSMLVLGLMVGFYIEISTPGFGIAGGIALCCLFFIGLSSYTEAGSAWLEWILLLVGTLLLALELFVIPGFGIVGFLGIILLLGALFSLILPSVESYDFLWNKDVWSAAGEEFMIKLAWLSTTFIVGMVLVYFLARYFLPKIALWSPLISKGEQEGYTAGLTDSEVPPIGSIGTSITRLRPSGKGEFNGVFYDVLTIGTFIEKLTPIKVIAIEGSRIFVEGVN